MRRWVVGALLAVSLGVNAYLLLAPTPTPHKTAAASPRTHRPAPVMRRVPEAIASAERAALETRLAVAEEKLEAILPPYAKFARASEPAPEQEARLQPILAKAFGDTAYVVECRDRMCRISAPKADPTWTNTVQGELHGMFKSMSVGQDIYGELADELVAASVRALTVPIHAFLASRAIADCRRDDPGTGTLWMSLQVDAGRYVVRVRAPHTDVAIGVCLRKALEDIAATTPIPPEVTSTQVMPFPVPLE